uniref:kxDL motif-containing protein 1-like n=1 Tax=Styela clava TaxID=7725 RepID=UPI0019396A4F|nr:kxDL motif-containing protein 1-like [Styela clava]
MDNKEAVMNSSTLDQKLQNLINNEDVDAIIKAQQTTLRRLEKSNAMLTNCNTLSSQQLLLASEKFTRHTATLQEMRKDLQSIFTRIRTLRAKLKTQYPGEFSLALENNMQNVSFQESGVIPVKEEKQNELYESSIKSHFSQKPDL